MTSKKWTVLNRKEKGTCDHPWWTLAFIMIVFVGAFFQREILWALIGILIGRNLC